MLQNNELDMVRYLINAWFRAESRQLYVYGKIQYFSANEIIRTNRLTVTECEVSDGEMAHEEINIH